MAHASAGKTAMAPSAVVRPWLWVIGLTSRGAGTLFGVIGGYAEGGDYDWASYSPAFGAATLALYRQAEATAALQ